MKREEELLYKALAEYWDWHWENMPSSQEIMKMHRFSSEFVESMEKLGKDSQKKGCSGLRVGLRVAGVLLALGLGIGVIRLWNSEGGNRMDVQTAEDQAENFQQESQTPLEDGGDLESNNASGQGNTQGDNEIAGENLLAVSWQISYLNETSLGMILKNTSEKPVNCSPILRVESWREGRWDIVWEKQDGWESDSLEEGDTWEEEINLEEHGVDSAGEYRFVREIEGQEITLALQIS